MARTKLSWQDRLKEFKTKTKHNEMVKGIYKNTTAKTIAYKYVLENKASGIKIFFYSRIIIKDYLTQMFIIDKRVKTITYYSKKLWELKVIANTTK